MLLIRIDKSLSNQSTVLSTGFLSAFRLVQVWRRHWFIRYVVCTDCLDALITV